MQRVAVVTGASSGIGRALALELQRDGYALGLTARRSEPLEALEREIGTLGGRAASQTADAADRAGTLAAIHALADALGPVDLLVANAGMGISKPVYEPNADTYEQMIRVNLLGPYYAVEAVLPSMLERGSGHLVAMSSLAKFVTGPGAGQYSATKAALSMWMDATRLELEPRGITCTTIQPGFIRTPMTDENDFEMPFLMDVDVAAQKIARAIRRRKNVYSFPFPMAMGARIGGLLPDWLRRRLMPERAEMPSLERPLRRKEPR